MEKSSLISHYRTIKRTRQAIFYNFLVINKSNEKTKTNTELILLTSSVYPKPDITYSSIP